METTFFLNNKKVELYFYLVSTSKASARQSVIRIFLSSVRNRSGNYAGFSSRQKLALFLKQEIFGFDGSYDVQNKQMDIHKITLIIAQTLQKCHQKISLPHAIRLHCFPSHNWFTNTKMFGVSGYTSDQKNIFLFISSQKSWRQQLKNTVAHEYTHLFAYRHHDWKTLLDSLIFEGIAENFRESAVGGKPSPWVEALSTQRSKAIFKKVKHRLQSVDERQYQRLFLGVDRRYPLWAGYAIGYQIIKSFVAHNPMSWPKIVKMKPNDILEKSHYR